MDKLNNTDKIIKTLLESKSEKANNGSGASDDLITSETLENELKAQQARIEKTFKDELAKLKDHFNNLEKENMNNGKENSGSNKGSNGEQKTALSDDSGTENDSDKGTE